MTNPPLYKTNDTVYSNFCEELDAPLMVIGLNTWRFNDVDRDGKRLYTYEVAGTHKKRGNIVHVQLFESQLTSERKEMPTCEQQEASDYPIIKDDAYYSAKIAEKVPSAKILQSLEIIKRLGYEGCKAQELLESALDMKGE